MRKNLKGAHPTKLGYKWIAGIAAPVMKKAMVPEKIAGKEKINNTIPLEIKVPQPEKGGILAVNIQMAVEDYQLHLSQPLIPVFSPSPEYVMTK